MIFRKSNWTLDIFLEKNNKKNEFLIKWLLKNNIKKNRIIIWILTFILIWISIYFNSNTILFWNEKYSLLSFMYWLILYSLFINIHLHMISKENIK